MTDLFSFYRGKRVFVTGHTGFKGGWLCRLLALAGAEVCGYAQDPAEPSFFRLCGFTGEDVRGDVRDHPRLSEAVRQFRPQLAFHLAAQPLVAEGFRFPRETFEVNVMGTVNFLEALRASPVRSAVVVTTDKVYAEEGKACREGDPLDGFDPYANSKSCADLISGCYARCLLQGTAVSRMRAGNSLGGGDYASGRILPDCVRAAERGEPVRVRDPRSVRPYQHVLEAVSAYLQLAAMQYEDPRLAGSYNVAPLCGTSTGELAGLFCAAWGCSWRQGGEPLPHEAAALYLEGSKLRGLGILPRWSVRQAVEKTVEWEKARLAGRDLRAVTDAQIEEYFSSPPQGCAINAARRDTE